MLLHICCYRICVWTYDLLNGVCPILHDADSLRPSNLGASKRSWSLQQLEPPIVRICSRHCRRTVRCYRPQSSNTTLGLANRRREIFIHGIAFLTSSSSSTDVIKSLVKISFLPSRFGSEITEQQCRKTSYQGGKKDQTSISNSEIKSAWTNLHRILFVRKRLRRDAAAANHLAISSDQRILSYCISC